MTQIQIKAAIAELMGWTCITMEHGRLRGNPCGLASARGDILDYCNSLNAMHDVENSLSIENHSVFRLNLISVLCKTDYERSIVSATALQRAEAVLRTMGKWVD